MFTNVSKLFVSIFVLEHPNFCLYTMFLSLLVDYFKTVMQPSNAKQYKTGVQTTNTKQEYKRVKQSRSTKQEHK